MCALIIMKIKLFKFRKIKVIKHIDGNIHTGL